MTVTIHVPDELPGVGRLGRHVEHDDRSRAFALEAVPISRLNSRRWIRRSPILDQGELGSCTGNAAAGWLATDNARSPGRSDITEAIAVELYSKATHLDRVKGFYPPEDTGSSGLAVAKAIKALFAPTTTYRHAFSLAAALTALQSGPVLLGQNWHEGMDHPDSQGLVHPTGQIRGGHETLIEGIDVGAQQVIVANSWSTAWGVHGYYVLSWSDLDQLLHERGDITVPA